LLIHPSLEESFGIVLIEAMFCKTPIIGGINSGAVPWILNGGNAGRLIDITDADSICRNAVDILSDSEVWNKYVEAGIERVKDFTLNHISDEYLKQYKKIVD
jgi:glycosyltransferase involved in cell wall biosynthesis